MTEHQLDRQDRVEGDKSWRRWRMSHIYSTYIHVTSDAAIFSLLAAVGRK